MSRPINAECTSCGGEGIDTDPLGLFDYPCSGPCPACWPAEPKNGERVWYRGWECYFSSDAHGWTGEGWIACYGGEDLDCVTRTASTWEKLLDEIDDFNEEDEL